MHVASKKQPESLPLFDWLEKEASKPQAAPVKRPKGRPAKPRPSRTGYDPVYDGVRLSRLQYQIFECMKDEQWRTFAEIWTVIKRGSENGIAASLRALRSKDSGSHTVKKRRRGRPELGLYEYKLIVNTASNVRPAKPVK